MSGQGGWYQVSGVSGRVVSAQNGWVHLVSSGVCGQREIKEANA